MDEEDKSLEELLNEVQELEDLFGDEEPNYDQIIDLFGIDIKELEKEMSNYQSKINVNYSFSREDSVDPQYAYSTDSGFDYETRGEGTGPTDTVSIIPPFIQPL